MNVKQILPAILLLALAHALPARAHEAADQPPPAAAVKQAKGGALTVELKGLGATDEDAKREALERAHNTVTYFMRKHGLNPPAPLTAAEVQQFVKSQGPRDASRRVSISSIFSVSNSA